MIIDFHRHLWSLAERYASAREIASRGSVLKADVTSPQEGGGAPIYVDQAAADFPGTNFVILHSGERCWFPVALDMARWKPNIYLELSLWQIEYTEDQENFIRTVQRIRKAIGLERVVFGSDLPGIAKVMSLADWAGVFRALPGAAARHGGRITQADVENMLGGNAARLLGMAGAR